MLRSVLILLAVAALGCEPAAPPPPPEARPLRLERLLEGSYRSDFVEGGTVTLHYGSYIDEARRMHINLLGKMAYGRVNDDDSEDAVVVLVTSSGGSGTFYDLAVVESTPRGPVNTASTSLGDRVRVDSLSVKDGYIQAYLLLHAPDDPLCCPTLPTTLSYRMQGGRLIRTDSSDTMHPPVQADGLRT